MEKKLSDLLSDLASKTKAIESEIENARVVSGKLLDKKIKESKAELQQKKNDFISHAENANTIMMKGFDSFKKAISKKVMHVKSDVSKKKEILNKKVDNKKRKLSVESARQQYHNAVDYAAFCIEWAAIALAEVETATLETFAAKQKLNDLKKKDTSA